MLIKVDLPAPFSPNSTWTSPARRSKSTSFSANTPGKCLEIPVISRRRSPWAACAVRGVVAWPLSIMTIPPILFRISRSRSRLDGEHRLEICRRQDKAEIDLIHIVLSDHVGNRLGALHIGLLFEHAHSGIDRDAA